MMEETNLKENPGSEMYGGDLFNKEEYTYRQHPAIANSDLKYLNSPKRFHLYKTQQVSTESTSEQEIGTLIDEYLLDQDRFNENFILQPEFEFEPSSGNQYGIVEDILQLNDPLNPSVDQVEMVYANNYANPNKDKAIEMYNNLKDYIDFQVKSQGKKVYTQSDLEMVKEIEKNCMRHELISWFLWGANDHIRRFTHLQIIGMEKWGIEWKGELDLVIVDFSNKVIYNIDLKSTGKPISSFGYEYYRKWNYKRQQALYQELLQWHLVEKGIIKDPSNWVWKIRCIVVETSYLNEVACIPIPHDVYQDGLEDLKEAARLIKHYRKHGWDRTISYNKNDGLEVIDWDKYRRN